MACALRILSQGRAAPMVTPQCAVVSVVPTMCSTKCHFRGKFPCGVASKIVSNTP
ncbi:hypothetical protein GQ55_6G070000 [Panicum hallii var. hallii]|uniref:Uncharacterized protein n=1 Tax=Panicum hallii var. hallii TaxID=1504633 RepID=A0A2T7D4S8_9POAL|nr:hypothetical protein GQ55_6G070000 [Panicum hallii var. hallii]